VKATVIVSEPESSLMDLMKRGRNVGGDENEPMIATVLQLMTEVPEFDMAKRLSLDQAELQEA
jgi:hypothetical protein